MFACQNFVFIENLWQIVVYAYPKTRILLKNDAAIPSMRPKCFTSHAFQIIGWCKKPSSDDFSFSDKSPKIKGSSWWVKMEATQGNSCPSVSKTQCSKPVKKVPKIRFIECGILDSVTSSAGFCFSMFPPLL